MEQSFRDMCLDYVKMHLRWYRENRRDGLPRTAAWNRRWVLYWIRQYKGAAA